MVHFVLNDPRLHARGLEVEGLAVLVRRLDGDGLAALDIGEDAGQGETSFLVYDGPAATRDDGVDQRAGPALAVVHDEEAMEEAHLRRSQPDANLVVHGLDHVGNYP